ncbi:serine-rich adhesin for platelets-like [Battus philenor]|uniref:serine-rich adhesin for platelets-like n=1 Tax=Battus philenor TaxID=42288 RepID=UPI0035CF0617
MDDTQSSRLSEAAPTRKRRSSILKSQRPPRTPFSELQPPGTTASADSAKSRRVSFSKRTGVAEFVTNEATTTWKTIYVEQNKSLESSENNSVMHPTVSHLGRRCFDQNLEYVEAETCDAFIMTGANIAQEMNMSLNVNFEEQITSNESNLDGKSLIAPQQNLELSSLTDHKSKIFGDDLRISTVDVSNKINIDFSAIQSLDEDKCDDLDEIQSDLRSRQDNFQGPRMDSGNVFGCVEVGLNMTFVGINNDDLDMSITETIQNPKVQEEPKNKISENIVKKCDNDWIADKENIAINPYITPKETANFAINEIPDHVLVFDGRKLIVESETNRGSDERMRKTILPRESLIPVQRKTIISNDEPNFVNDTSILRQVHDDPTNRVFDEKENVINTEIAFTKMNNIDNKSLLPSNAQKTVIYDSGDIADVSVTQAIPTNIILAKEKRRTIVFENDAGNISMTQAVPANVVIASRELRQDKTIVYDAADISCTRTVPTKFLPMLTNENLILPTQNDFDISFTQAVPNNMIMSNKSIRRNTTVYDTDGGDISMTRVLPSNIVDCENRNEQLIINPTIPKKTEAGMTREDNKFNKTGIYDMSVTQCVNYPINLHSSNKTILDDRDQFNVSETRVIPTNIIEYDRVSERNVMEMKMDPEIEKRLSIQTENFNMSMTTTVPEKILSYSFTNRRQTDDVNDLCDISVTQAIPTNIIEEQEGKQFKPLLIDAPEDKNHINNLKETEETKQNSDLNDIQNQQTIKTTQNSVAFSDKTIPMSTNTVELNISVKNDCTNFHKSHVDMSITEAIHTNDIASNINSVCKQENVVHNNATDISVTQSIKANILVNEIKSNIDKTILDEKKIENELASMSICNSMVITTTQPCKINIITNSSFSMSKDNANTSTINNQTASGQLCSEPVVENFPHQYDKQSEKASSETLDDDLHNTNNKNDLHRPEQNEVLLSTMNYLDGRVQKFDTNNPKSVTDHNYQDVFVYQAVTSHNVSKHQVVRIENVKELEENENENENQNSREPLEVIENPKDINLSLNDVPQHTDVKEGNNQTKELQKSKKHNRKRSILSKLLNMSNDSSDGIDDKNVMAKVDHSEVENDYKYEIVPVVCEAPVVISELKEESIGTKSCLHKHEDLNTSGQENNIEKIRSSISGNEVNKSVEAVESKISSENKYIKEADDTNDLLEMLTDLTDKTIVKQSVPENDDEPNDEVKSNVSNVDKSIPNDPKPLGISKSRVSIMLSREDLLNNISMARAVLQQATHIDDSEMLDSSHETVQEELDEADDKLDLVAKPAKVSTDVVKTLQFDDSVSEVISTPPTNMSPLKKTAFGDMSELKDSKVKVIPSYLMDVSDEIQSLMKDLVKPAADVMPFETSGVDRIDERSTEKPSSTNSIEIQANIITSSQIDIDIESNPASEYNMRSFKHDKSDERSGSVVSEMMEQGDDDNASSLNRVHQNNLTKPLIVFDHANPLNNVILSPSGNTEVHTYRPKISASPKSESETLPTEKESPEDSLGSVSKNAIDEAKSQIVSTHYNVNVSPIRSENQIRYSSHETIEDRSVIVVSSGDETEFDSARGNQNKIKDIETNTLIAMKSNKELLQASSSLTIVDEERQDVVVIEETKEVTPEKKTKRTSPVKVIFKLDDEIATANSESSEISDTEAVKAKKRIYSPAKNENKLTPSTLEVTPKPCNKIQKMSTNPNLYRNAAHRATTAKLNASMKENDSESDKIPTKKSPKSITSPNKRNSIIVQRVDCKIKNTEAKDKVQTIGDEFGLTSCSTLKSVGTSQKEYACARGTDSFVSSNAMKKDSSSTTITVSGEEQESRTTIEVESSTDVLNKIAKLPFMGTQECEWDYSDQETWRFLLMRKVLRLTVNFKNGPGDQHWNVRDDTPVVGASIEVAQEQQEVALCACAKLACEAMRYEVSRGAATAQDVPTLLRRCVGVARVARQWGRVMYEARLHLAYKLTDSGRLVLQVVNRSLRSVFELSMRIELVVEDARELAWARAGHVTVRDITDDHVGTSRTIDVQRLVARVPHDWAHVPRTLWKVFRYLKNKTEDNELLLDMDYKYPVT